MAIPDPKIDPGEISVPTWKITLANQTPQNVSRVWTPKHVGQPSLVDLGPLL